jgi:hypothetical protein
MTPSSPHEEITIRVLRNGRIVIDGSGLPPRRLQELQQTLEEVLGPARLFDEERRQSPEAPRIWGVQEQPVSQQDVEKTHENT